jgi:hypothetical protein
MPTPTRYFKTGDRVELMPHMDLWMMGARYGTVHKITRTHVHVKMDKLGDTLKAILPDSIQHAEW